MTYTLDLSEQKQLSLSPETETEATLQRLYCLLSTAIGEVPCYRAYGLDKSYLHMPVTVARTLFVSALTGAMSTYFPELKLDNVDFTAEDGKGPLGIFSCRIEVSDSAES